MLAAANETTALTEAANAGRTNVIPDIAGSSKKFTLPTPSGAGVYYHFIYGGAAADAHNLVIQPVTGDNSVYFKGSITHLDTTADENVTAVISDGDSNDTMTLKVLEGLDLHCLALSTTVWYIWGTVTAATVPTIAD